MLWRAKPQLEEHIIYGAAIDITNLKRAESAWRESEELKQRILESSNDCIKVLNLESEILYMSNGGCCLLEIDDPTLVFNASWIDFWEGEAQERAKTAIAAAKTGSMSRFQGNCPTRNGTPKWWDSVITPVRDAAGQVVQLVAISRDMTQQKQAEDRLHESEKQIRNILESINDGFFALDVNWRFTYVNRAAETLLDRTANDLIGQSIWDAYPGLDNSEFEQLYWRVMRDRVSGSTTAFYPDHDYAGTKSTVIQPQRESQSISETSLSGFKLLPFCANLKTASAWHSNLPTSAPGTGIRDQSVNLG